MLLYLLWEKTVCLIENTCNNKPGELDVSKRMLTASDTVGIEVGIAVTLTVTEGMTTKTNVATLTKHWYTTHRC